MISFVVEGTSAFMLLSCQHGFMQWTFATYPYINLFLIYPFRWAKFIIRGTYIMYEYSFNFETPIANQCAMKMHKFMLNLATPSVIALCNRCWNICAGMMIYLCCMLWGYYLCKIVSAVVLPEYKLSQFCEKICIKHLHYTCVNIVTFSPITCTISFEVICIANFWLIGYVLLIW